MISPFRTFIIMDASERCWEPLKPFLASGKPLGRLFQVDHSFWETSNNHYNVLGTRLRFILGYGPFGYLQPLSRLQISMFFKIFFIFEELPKLSPTLETS
jgi:hypothetical protein